MITIPPANDNRHRDANKNARRRKNLATLGALLFLVVLVYLIAIVRMSGKA